MEVTLSYEEKIINAIVYQDHGGRGVIERDKRLFDVIRRILQPLYDEIDILRRDKNIPN